MNIEQHPTRDAWLAARSSNHGIGASTATAIVGMSSYRGPWAVWSERNGGPVQPPSPALIRGQVLEPIVLSVWSAMQSEPVTGYDNAIVRHPEHPWFYFSPDGIRHTRDGPIPVEVKTSRWDKDWPTTPVLEIGNRELRKDYIWQPVAQACVLGAPRAELLGCLFDHDTCSLLDELCMGAWLRGDAAGAVPVLTDIVKLRGEFRHHVIHVPDGADKRFIEVLSDWRERHLVRGEEPPYDGSSQYIDDATTAKGFERDPLPVGSPEVEALVAAWQADKTDANRNAVMVAMRDVPGFDFGARSVSWRLGGGGEKVVALSKIERTHPEVAATLRSEGLTETSKRYRFPVAKGEW